jgi:predicted nucleic acid-binding protein
MILLDTNICIDIINTKPPSMLARLWQHRERMPGRKSRLERQNLKGHP